MYWKKTWKYGNRVDVKKYNTFRCPGKGGAGRGERVKPTTEQMAAVNEWNAKKKLKRILIANFEFGDWHLTLTYAPDRRPDVEGSRACLRKFFEKLRKRYRECGKELKYVVVTEWERKAIHHHLAVNDLPGLNKVLAELW